MKIIDGKTLAQNLRKNIANEVKQYSRPPGLAVVLVARRRRVSQEHSRGVTSPGSFEAESDRIGHGLRHC